MIGYDKKPEEKTGGREEVDQETKGAKLVTDILRKIENPNPEVNLMIASKKQHHKLSHLQIQTPKKEDCGCLRWSWRKKPRNFWPRRRRTVVEVQPRLLWIKQGLLRLSKTLQVRSLKMKKKMTMKIRMVSLKKMR